MPLHHFECPQGHTTRKMVRVGVVEVSCETCGEPAPKTWKGSWGSAFISGERTSEVVGMGRMTTSQIDAHLADLKRRTGKDHVAEFCTPKAVNTRLDELDHRCWVADKEEGESPEKFADRQARITEAVAPRVKAAREAGESEYDAMKAARAEFNAENPVDKE